MKVSNGVVVFRAFGDEDENGDESGTTTTDISATPEFQEALKTHLAKALDAETAGLKGKLSEVLGEKKKVQDQYNAILAQAEDEKDKAALKEGKLDVQALIDKKVSARDQTWQERLAAEQSEKEELRKAVEGERGKLKQFQIKQFVINEALKNEFFQPTAAEDLSYLAANSWDLTENGELISRDSEGNVSIGKNGKALTPGEWIEGLQKTKPHYFKTQSGSGSKPGGQGGSKTVSRQDWQSMIVDADQKGRAELMEKRAKGEIVIAA